jgi:osmotically inducible lipoprotein OsmB
MDVSRKRGLRVLMFPWQPPRTSPCSGDFGATFTAVRTQRRRTPLFRRHCIDQLDAPLRLDSGPSGGRETHAKDKKKRDISVRKLPFSLLTIGLFAAGLGACTTGQERMSGAGTGVVAGAAVGGPVGAVVGGVAGAITGPSVAHASGVPHRHHHYYWRNGHRYYTYY